MSSEATPDKTSNLLYKNSTVISQKNQRTIFSDKIKDIKQVLRQLVLDEKILEIESYLDQLQEIYNADTAKDKISKEEKEYLAHQKSNKKSEKVILEAFQGKKIQNDIKIENESRAPRSPEKKGGEEKRFVKFEPKKSLNMIQTSLLAVRKNSPTK